MSILAALLVAPPTGAGAAPASKTIAGKVVHVADGDTITVLVADKRRVKVRLYGIDCPEKAQPFGKAAKRFTSKIAAGKRVRVQVVAHHRHGRTIGRVNVGELSLNRELVKVGLAWWYRKYAPNAYRLASLQAAAKQAKRGLWSDPKHIPPWEWRRGVRAPGATAKADGRCRKASDCVLQKCCCQWVSYRRGAPAPAVCARGCPCRRPLLPANAYCVKGQCQVAGLYRGNRRSKVFHAPSCRHYRCKLCTVSFKRRAAARKAGYRPHRRCVR